MLTSDYLPQIVCLAYYAEQLSYGLLMPRRSLAATLAMCVPLTAALSQASVDAHPPIYFELPGMENVSVTTNLVYKTVAVAARPARSLTLDVYAPPTRSTTPAPIVVFVHGGLTTDSRGDAKDWSSYQRWGRLVAASGMVGVTFNHRLTTDDNVDEASPDVADALAFIRRRAADFSADPNRVCLAFYSAGGVLSGALLHDAPSYVRCVVLYYPFLDLEHLRTKTVFREPHSSVRVDSLAGFSPRDALARARAPLPPIFLARAGRDEIPRLNESVDRFVAAALANNARIDLYTHPDGVHGFDIRTRDERTREIIAQTLAFFRRHLMP